jgi:hypothetical protein
MTNPKCISCSNENIEKLGEEVQDNFIDCDYYCGDCGNLFSTHYDLTRFKADVDNLLNKYPDLKTKISDNNKRRSAAGTTTTATTATREGGTEEEKAQNVALASEDTNNQNNTIAQSPTAKTNKKNLERQGSSE